MKNIIFLLIILSLPLPSQAALLKDGEPTLAVSGKGRIKTRPDVAYITAGVERTAKTATEAQDIAAQKMENVMAGLEKAGIPKDKIETVSYRLYPEYEYDRGKRNFVGYTARNEVKITLKDLKSAGKIIDKAILAGATSVNNIVFTIEDEAPLKKKALQKAVADAKEKAQTIADAAGLVIKRIMSISESGARIIPPASGVLAMKAEGVGAGAETPITPGMVEVQAHLNMVYEVR